MVAPQDAKLSFFGSSWDSSKKITWSKVTASYVVGYRVYRSSDTNPTETVVHETSHFDILEWTDTSEGFYNYKVVSIYKAYGVTAESSYSCVAVMPGTSVGYVFYDKGSYSDGWRYLEAVPANLPTPYQWGAYAKNVVGTKTELGSGKNNTAVIVAFLKTIGETGKAAKVADTYSYGGYSDWFLPSKDELNLMYENLHKKGIGDFIDGTYWSSSQPDAYMCYQNFPSGTQFNGGKGLSNSVRVVRAF